MIGEAQWEPLISWEDFQRLQCLFADLDRRTKGGDDSKWLARSNAAQEQREALQARLDEAIGQYSAGETNLDTMAKIEHSSAVV